MCTCTCTRISIYVYMCMYMHDYPISTCVPSCDDPAVCSGKRDAWDGREVRSGSWVGGWDEWEGRWVSGVASGCGCGCGHGCCGWVCDSAVVFVAALCGGRLWLCWAVGCGVSCVAMAARELVDCCAPLSLSIPFRASHCGRGWASLLVPASLLLPRRWPEDWKGGKGFSFT